MLSGLRGRVPPWGSRALAGGLLVFGLVLPLLVPPSSGFLNATIIAVAYAVMSLGLNIVVGFAGLLDLGYVAFYGFGAYGYAMLAAPKFGLHWSTLAVVPVVMVATMILGLLVVGAVIRAYPMRDRMVLFAVPLVLIAMAASIDLVRQPGLRAVAMAATVPPMTATSMPVPARSRFAVAVRITGMPEDTVVESAVRATVHDGAAASVRVSTGSPQASRPTSSDGPIRRSDGPNSPTRI